MFIPTLPVFDTETICVACLPIATWPKFTLAGLNWKEALDDVCFAPVTIPAQPVNREKRGLIEAIRNNPHSFLNFLRTRLAWVLTVCAGPFLIMSLRTNFRRNSRLSRYPP